MKSPGEASWSHPNQCLANRVSLARSPMEGQNLPYREERKKRERTLRGTIRQMGKEIRRAPTPLRGPEATEEDLFWKRRRHTVSQDETHWPPLTSLPPSSQDHWSSSVKPPRGAARRGQTEGPQLLSGVGPWWAWLPEGPGAGAAGKMSPGPEEGVEARTRASLEHKAKGLIRSKVISWWWLSH